MLLKLIALAAMAQVALAGDCCLPDAFQFTMLSETRHQHMGNFAIRSRVVMAANLTEGRVGVFTSTNNGYNSAMYINLRSGRVFVNSAYGCSSMPVNSGILTHVNRSRCLPDDIGSGESISIRLGEDLNARLLTKQMPGNTTMNVLIDEKCHPILVKVGGPGFDSTSILGDFLPAPQPGLLDPPAACSNASSTRAVNKKRSAAVTLTYNHSPMFV
ncbi:hypothetical protein BOX15_Mlig032370g2 [Macrostomum lignano]|uniref:Uncharacterized protein n=1 Tax=Macrostomum lignano TaxID=282301 RepID=A0A267EPB9_9PLAT|nr:hypothetical protein BOX15_Mlig032370g2 [Macrostomum lignano]